MQWVHTVARLTDHNVNVNDLSITTTENLNVQNGIMSCCRLSLSVTCAILLKNNSKGGQDGQRKTLYVLITYYAIDEEEIKVISDIECGDNAL